MDKTWFIPGKASVLIGGQFGSEAKGLAAAYMAMANIGDLNDQEYAIATTNAGAQAGHTTKFEDGSGFVCYHLPTTSVVLEKFRSRWNGKVNLRTYLNGGAIIDPELFVSEIEHLGVKLNHQIIVHPSAAVIDEDCREAERAKDGPAKIASTGKGVGAALARKILRKSNSTLKVADSFTLSQMPKMVQSYTLDLNEEMRKNNAPVVCEIPQGTGLGINHGGFFPNCTSRDCWVGAGLADAGIHPSFLGNVCMVVRTFPIRVGNTPTGYSGDFYPDSVELDWGDLRYAVPELTTVTKRVRRIATFSTQQYEAALRLNRPTHVFLSFINYLENASAFGALMTKLDDVASKIGQMPRFIFSWGPNVEDVGDRKAVQKWLTTRDRLEVRQAPDPVPSVAPPVADEAGLGSSPSEGSSQEAPAPETAPETTK